MSVSLQCTKHSARFLTTVANHTVQTAGTRGMVWLKSIVPTQQIYMLLLFSIYSVISLEIITFFLPIASFYAAFFAMVICTMQMVYRYVMCLLIGCCYLQFVLSIVICCYHSCNMSAHSSTPLEIISRFCLPIDMAYLKIKSLNRLLPIINISRLNHVCFYLQRRNRHEYTQRIE